MTTNPETSPNLNCALIAAFLLVEVAVVPLLVPVPRLAVLAPLVAELPTTEAGVAPDKTLEILVTCAESIFALHGSAAAGVPNFGQLDILAAMRIWPRNVGQFAVGSGGTRPSAMVKSIKPCALITSPFEVNVLPDCVHFSNNVYVQLRLHFPFCAYLVELTMMYGLGRAAVGLPMLSTNMKPWSRSSGVESPSAAI